MKLANIGIIGLGTIGKPLADGLAKHDKTVAVLAYDENTPANSNRPASDAQVFSDPDTFFKSLPRPATFFLAHSEHIDADLVMLAKHLSDDDVVIDASGEYPTQICEYQATMASKGIPVLTGGVWHIETGPQKGFHFVLGGDRKAFDAVTPLLTDLAADNETVRAVTYVGPGVSGAFTNVVQCAIRDVFVQLLEEAYVACRSMLELTPDEVATVFSRWNEGRFYSFLVENAKDALTAFGVEDPLTQLRKSDVEPPQMAAMCTQYAANLGVSVSTIAAALFVPTTPIEGQLASTSFVNGSPSVLFRSPISLSVIHDAAYASLICTFAQGIDLISSASKVFGWEIDLAAVARAWAFGATIRSQLGHHVFNALNANPDENICRSDGFVNAFRRTLPHWRRLVAAAVVQGMPIPTISASLQYFDNHRCIRTAGEIVRLQQQQLGIGNQRGIEVENTVLFGNTPPLNPEFV